MWVLKQNFGNISVLADGGRRRLLQHLGQADDTKLTLQSPYTVV